MIINCTCSGDLNSAARNRPTAMVQLNFCNCQNFDLTPTFAKIDKERSSKWKQSSVAFERNVVSEELKEKIKQSASLKCEINSIYDEIRRSCSLFRYTCILRTMVNLRNKYYQEVMSTHTKKIARCIAQNSNFFAHYNLMT